jgi:hypothetical protein
MSEPDQTRDDTIDKLVLAAAGNEWVKTAVLISKVFDAPALKGIDGLGQIVAERIYILVDHGRLEAKGNMRRWRDSEIRLVQGKE